MNNNLLNKLSKLPRVIFVVTFYALFLFVQGEVQGACDNNCNGTGVCFNDECYTDIDDSSTYYGENWDSSGLNCVSSNYDTANNCQSCEGNWNIYNDCKTCIGWFDSSAQSNCNDCINTNFADIENCTTCSEKYDINTGCTTCIARYDDAGSGCQSCKFPFIGDECSYIACRRDSDIHSSYSWDCGTYGSCDSEHGVCICSDNMLPDCTACINEFLDTAGCSNCKNNKLDISTLCTTCTDANLLVTEEDSSTCTTCIAGPLYSTDDCNNCSDPSYNPDEGCKVCKASPKLNPSPNVKCTECINPLSSVGDLCVSCRGAGYDTGTQCTQCIRKDIYYRGPDSELINQDNCNRCMPDSDRSGPRNPSGHWDTSTPLWDTTSCTSCRIYGADTEDDCSNCQDDFWDSELFSGGACIPCGDITGSEQLSWDAASAFCSEQNALDHTSQCGGEYRLRTIAENKDSVDQGTWAIEMQMFYYGAGDSEPSVEYYFTGSGSSSVVSTESRHVVCKYVDKASKNDDNPVLFSKERTLGVDSENGAVCVFAPLPSGDQSPAFVQIKQCY